MKTRQILKLVFFTSLICSCTDSTSYPTLLVEADSAFMRGIYQQGDNLLSYYERETSERDIAIENYHRLIYLEQNFMHGTLAHEHFSIADSLCNFYEKRGEHEKQIKAMLFYGNIHQNNQNYPEALSFYLKARQLAKKSNNNKLLLYIARCQGDIYFRQRMLKECIPYYREYYHLASANADTLRMAYAAQRMGKVCTINDDVDSTIYYYKLANRLAHGLNQEESIVSATNRALCDIYIQTEQYDSALAIMPRNEQNIENWAYWHYAQQHVDSAICYFRQTLGKYGWQVETENLRILAELEQQRGNADAALGYYDALATAEDSLRAESMAEETRRVNTQYEYMQVQAERDKMEQRNKWLHTILAGTGVIVVLLLAAGYLAWKSFRQKRETVREHEKRLLRETDLLHQQSEEQLNENRQQLAVLKRLLAEAQLKGDTEHEKELRLDTESLEAKNLNIEVLRRQNELRMSKLRQQPLYRKIISNTGPQATILKEEDWLQLARLIDSLFDNLTARLLDLAKLKDTDLRVCYLLKLEMSSIDIARMMGRTRSAISMKIANIYQKLTCGKGGVDDLAFFIQHF